MIESRYYFVQRLNTLLLQLLVNAENFVFELFSGQKVNFVRKIPNSALDWTAGLCVDGRCLCCVENYQLQNGSCVPTQTVQAQIEDAKAQLRRDQEASGGRAHLAGQITACALVFLLLLAVLVTRDHYRIRARRHIIAYDENIQDYGESVWEEYD